MSGLFVEAITTTEDDTLEQTDVEPFGQRDIEMVHDRIFLSDQLISYTVVGVTADLVSTQVGNPRPQLFVSLAQHPASTVLAKHDENYMPKEVVEALKASGEWQREGAGQ